MEIFLKTRDLFILIDPGVIVIIFLETASHDLV